MRTVDLSLYKSKKYLSVCVCSVCVCLKYLCRHENGSGVKKGGPGHAPWKKILNISCLKAWIWCILREKSSKITRQYECIINMVTLCYTRNETDNLSHEMHNSTTLTVQSATEWKKQTLKECVLTRWIWVLKKLLSLCLEERCWLQCVDAMTCTFFLCTSVWQCACSAWLPLFA